MGCVARRRVYATKTVDLCYGVARLRSMLRELARSLELVFFFVFVDLARVYRSFFVVFDSFML